MACYEHPTVGLDCHCIAPVRAAAVQGNHAPTPERAVPGSLGGETNQDQVVQYLVYRAARESGMARHQHLAVRLQGHRSAGIVLAFAIPEGHAVHSVAVPGGESVIQGTVACEAGQGQIIVPAAVGGLSRNEHLSVRLQRHGVGPIISVSAVPGGHPVGAEGGVQGPVAR